MSELIKMPLRICNNPENLGKMRSVVTEISLLVGRPLKNNFKKYRKNIGVICEPQSR